MDIHIHGCIHMKNILPLGENRQNMAGPEKYGLWDAEKRNGFGENLSCFRSLEEHSLRETIEVPGDELVGRQCPIF